MTQGNADQAVHEAARAGLIDKLTEMLAVDPSLVEAAGMDARTPLHCAGTVAAAALLLDHGARIDACDEDHASTPAQWLIGDSPDIAKFLLERGAKADIFLAAALGDVALAERLVSDLSVDAELQFLSSPNRPQEGTSGDVRFPLRGKRYGDAAVGELRVGAARGGGSDREAHRPTGLRRFADFGLGARFGLSDMDRRHRLLRLRCGDLDQPIGSNCTWLRAHLNWSLQGRCETWVLRRLDRGPEKGTFVINSVGENLVAMTLPDGGVPKKSYGAGVVQQSPRKN